MAGYYDGWMTEDPGVLEQDNNKKTHNQDLAKNVYSDIYEEDIERIDDLTAKKLKDVEYWLNYDEVKDEDTKDFNLLSRGLIKTHKGRPFMDAVIEYKKGKLAYALICNRNNTVRLYMAVLLYGNELDLKNLIQMVRYSTRFNNSDSLLEFYRNLFNMIEIEYNNFKGNARLTFLLRVKSMLGKKLPVPKDKEIKERVKVLFKSIEDNPWRKDLKKLDK